jgi:outer membrane lipoprotein-sorting protein
MKILLSLLVLIATPLHAALTLDEVLAKMDQTQQSLEDVSFQFVQRTRRGELPEERTAGEVWAKKPTGLRVVQTVPQKQVLVTDGKTFWLHTPSQKQQLKGDWQAWVQRSRFPLPLIDFMGTLSPEHWRSRYKVLFGGYEKPLYKLLFKPLKPEDAALTLWVSEENFLPARGQMQEESFQVDVDLKNLKINSHPIDGLFKPKVPAGTEEIPVHF